MAPRPFVLLRSRKLGQLTAEQRLLWRQLLLRQRRVAVTEGKLLADMSLFMDSVTADFLHDTHGAADGIDVTAEGGVVQAYCICFKCQASLQSLPPTFVVEEMVKQKLIAPDKVTEARREAAKMEKVSGRPQPN